MPPPLNDDQSRIFLLAEKFRAELLAQDQAVTTQMVARYSRVWTRAKQELDVLQAEIAAAQAAGKLPFLPPPGSGIRPHGPARFPQEWLTRERRIKKVLATVEAEVREFVPYADLTILNYQKQMIEAAQTHAHGLLGDGLDESAPGLSADLMRTNPENYRQLAGFLGNEAPLRDLLDTLPPDASRAVAFALTDSIGRGLNPEQVARSMRKALGTNLARAITISRTEALRVYREVTRREYEANNHVVRGWVWSARLDTRTCASCWAMHGTEHPLEERLNDHPRGRCAMLPLTATWEDLGIEGVPDTRPPVKSGTAVFGQLSENQKLAILGPAKLKAYKAGDITLKDLVGFRENDVWGSMRYERSLKRVKAGLDKNRVFPVPKKPPALEVYDYSEPAPVFPWGSGLDVLVENKDLTGKLGGVTRDKVVYDAPDGSSWLFKPQDPLRITIDVQVSKLMGRAGFKAAETFDVVRDGKRGSLQRMFPNARNRFGKWEKGQNPVAPDRIKGPDMEALEEQSVLDWLIGNHDTHQEQFLRVSGDPVPIIGIDKTQAWKFLGAKSEYTDQAEFLGFRKVGGKLDWYDPNHNLDFNGGSVYNRFWRAFAENKDVPAFDATLKEGKGALAAIRRLQAIPEDEFRDLLRPVALERARRGARVAGDEFIEAVELRRKLLLADFDHLYARLREERQAIIDRLRREAEEEARRLAREMAERTGVTTGLKGMDAPAVYRDPKSNVGTATSVIRAEAKRLFGNTEKATLSELEAIQNYTGASYRAINEALFKGRLSTAADSVRRSVRNLDSFFEKNRVTEDVIVSRGSGSFSMFAKALEGFTERAKNDPVAHGLDVQTMVGKTVEVDNYISTGHGFSFGGQVKTRIRLNSGSKAAWVQPHSSHASENEVLIARGQRLFIHAVRVETGPGGNRLYHVDVEVVPEGTAGPKVESARERKNRLERERYAKKKAAEKAAKEAQGKGYPGY